jgi:uroporphyrin-III C-methyltransferase/precorrin-2 dehydrogenase/sirohydrochlorin ferrochelatase
VRALFPLFLDLEKKRVVVIGGGSVGARKVRELIEARAEVTVVAKDASPEVASLAAQGMIALRSRAFVPRDLDGAWLAIAATSDPEVNARVARAGEARRVFVNAVDDPTRSSAYFASILRRAPFTVAISSTGEAPALSRLLREVIEEILPGASWVEEARALRARWREERVPMGERFGALVRAFARRRG